MEQMLSKIEVAAKADDMGAVKAALDAKAGSRPGALAAAAVAHPVLALDLLGHGRPVPVPWRAPRVARTSAAAVTCCDLAGPGV